MDLPQKIITAGLALLPPEMDTPAARGMLYAIGRQESRFLYRRQIGGPARSFWQFEKAGIKGVLSHHASASHIRGVLSTLKYSDDLDISYAAIEHNDLLAVCYARLLLWTLPGSLPGPDEADDGWRQYLRAWRPGKPHPDTWAAFYAEAADIDWGVK